MRNLLPFVAAAAPGAVIFACVRSMSRERRTASRSARVDVERLISELDELLGSDTVDPNMDLSLRSARGKTSAKECRIHTRADRASGRMGRMDRLHR